MVVLVLQAAGEETCAADAHGSTVEAVPFDHRMVVARCGGLQAWERKTALRPADGHTTGLHKTGIEHMAAVAAVLVIGAVVDEKAELNADLRGGQTDPAVRVHRGVHILHELRERLVRSCDLL